MHRLIERHAATNGDALAVIDGESSCSYRELNAAANVLARRLIAAGFRHGMRADVPMAPSVDLAVTLLAILKAGGCYTVGDTDTVSATSSDIAPSFLIRESAGKTASCTSATSR